MILWRNIDFFQLFIILIPTPDFPHFYYMLGGNLGSLLYGDVSVMISYITRFKSVSNRSIPKETMALVSDLILLLNTFCYVFIWFQHTISNLTPTSETDEHKNITKRAFFPGPRRHSTSKVKSFKTSYWILFPCHNHFRMSDFFYWNK